MVDSRDTSEPVQLTLKAAAQIRGLIIDGVLLPGEKIRQVELADRVGVSRSPLREALRTLESEGVVTYEANRGYVVARLERQDLAEIYRMRALLESELLTSITRPDKQALWTLSKHNTAMMDAIAADDISEVLRSNRDFHFTIFELSPMKQFKREIRRLWQLTEGYRTWWWRSAEAADRIDAEHREIIDVLRRSDLERLVVICNRHRVGGLEPSISGVATL